MKCVNIAEYLGQNTYPGRGVMLGRSADGKSAVIGYFIMGRSVNSRNRIFTETEDGIRTQAFDKSKMEDPSLIIYHPVRELNGSTIVTNGDQTDTVRDFMAEGKTFREALLTREFEPDGPNYTPRISGLLNPDGGYQLSILKSLDGDPACCCRYFYEYDKPQAGFGHIIHTYMTDGDPLPSFGGEPVKLTVDAPDAAAMAELLWNSLNGDNKVSLFVRYIDLTTGAAETVIKNKHLD